MRRRRHRETLFITAPGRGLATLGVKPHWLMHHLNLFCLHPPEIVLLNSQGPAGRPFRLYEWRHG